MTDELSPREDTGYVNAPDPEDRPNIRRREPRHADGATHQPSPVVTQAKCQAAPFCRNTVDVTAHALGALETFSAILERRGEKPLELNACFMCDPCRSKLEAALAELAEKRRSKVNEAVKFLREMNLEQLVEAHGLVKARCYAGPGAAQPVVEAIVRLDWLGKVQGTGYVNDLVTFLSERGRAAKSKRGGDI